MLSAVAWSPWPPRQSGGRRVGLGEQAHDAGAGPVGRVVVAGAVGVGAACTVAAEGAVDDARIRRGYVVPAEAEAFAPPGDEVGDENVAALGQPLHDVGAAGLLEVDGDGALAEVVEFEGGVAGKVEIVAERAELESAVHVAAGRFDLDDVGAEVGHEAGRGRGRQPVGDFDDADTIERCGHGTPPRRVGALCARPGERFKARRRVHSPGQGDRASVRREQQPGGRIQRPRVCGARREGKPWRRFRGSPSRSG
ncbi:MAG: hypothetical protein U5Q44_12860 [Dehalococcoidia bacterium]|nr:hypothetical protein [Dehalococcoidia bacterium]